MDLMNLKMWMSPSGANEHPEPGSIEMKTSWRDFGTAAACPTSHFHCQGRFGLVGLHYVNKTFSHGECLCVLAKRGCDWQKPA